MRSAIEARLSPELVVANPVPAQFWKRDMHWRGAGLYGAGTYTLGQTPKVTEMPMSTVMSDPRIARAIERSADARAFLFWSRMPLARIDGDNLVLSDQRFGNRLTRGTFEVRVPLERLQ